MSCKLCDILHQFKGQADEVIPILQAVQNHFGYLSEHAMADIAKFTNVPESRIYAVATFYAQFRFTPIGKKHIMVCRGTACHVRGAPRILESIENTLGIKEGGVTEDGEYSLETVACIGCCGLAPCIMMNNEVSAKLTPKTAAKLFVKDDKNAD